MSSIIKFAVVGCGSIGKRHIAVLDSMANAELVAICDLDADRREEQSELYDKIPNYVSYEEMLVEAAPEVVCICTPHHLHMEMAIAAAELKVNIVVEKPMALSVADCNRMIEAAEKSGVLLSVVKQNRYNVPVRLAKDALSKGRLGKIFMVKCDILWNRYQGYYDDSPWRGQVDEEGGSLFTLASHFIDLLVWWFGDVTEVVTFMETQNHQIETEDSGCAVLKFDSGTMGSMVWTTCVYNNNYEGSITIVGEKGTIKIGGQYLNKIEYWDVSGYPLPDTIDYDDQPNMYGKYQGTSSNHDKVLHAVIEKLLQEDVEVVEGGEGMRSIAAIEKIYNSR